MDEKLKTLLSAFAGGVIALAFVHAVTALADGNPATDQVPKLIPYQGTLEKDGTGVTGQVPMTFSLFDGSAATTAAWTEKQTVNVFGGRFLALLGSTTADSATNLAKAISNADDLYLMVTLTTGSGDVPLSNRQRFLPVPYALWTTAATDFKVGHNLTVGGAATITGTLIANGDVAVIGNLNAESNVSVGLYMKQCNAAGGVSDCSCVGTVSGGFACQAGSTGFMSYPIMDPNTARATGWHAMCRNSAGSNVNPDTVWVMCSRLQ